KFPPGDEVHLDQLASAGPGGNVGQVADLPVDGRRLQPLVLAPDVGCVGVDGELYGVRDSVTGPAGLDVEDAEGVAPRSGGETVDLADQLEGADVAVDLAMRR